LAKKIERKNNSAAWSNENFILLEKFKKINGR
jgi:hypothetical protein